MKERQKAKKTSLTLDPELYRQARIRAAETGVKVRDVVEAALAAYLVPSRREIARRDYVERVIPAAIRDKEARRGSR